MKKRDVKIEQLEDGTIDDLSSALMVDAVIDLLLKKKIITKTELNSQLEKNRGNMQEFIKKNPGLIQKLKEDVDVKRQQALAGMDSYIG